MNAIKIGNEVALVFTTVIDLFSQGNADEDEAVQAPTTRDSWEQRASKSTVAIADQLLALIKQFAPNYDLKYNRPYIGLTKDNKPNNFAYFIPGKSALTTYLKLDPPQELLTDIEASGLDFQAYNKKHGTSQIRLTATDVKKHEAILTKLLMAASGIDVTV